MTKAFKSRQSFIYQYQGLEVKCPKRKGSDYRYAWPDTIQIKGSVYHSNSVDLIA